MSNPFATPTPAELRAKHAAKLAAQQAVEGHVKTQGLASTYPRDRGSYDAENAAERRMEHYMDCRHSGCSYWD